MAKAVTCTLLGTVNTIAAAVALVDAAEVTATTDRVEIIPVFVPGGITFFVVQTEIAA